MITKCFEISTAHISEETAAKIQHEVELNEMMLSVYEKDGYGWWIYLGNIDSMSVWRIPDDLLNLICLAIKNGCDWLCLDRDAEIIEELTTFDWQVTPQFVATSSFTGAPDKYSKTFGRNGSNAILRCEEDYI